MTATRLVSIVISLLLAIPALGSDSGIPLGSNEGCMQGPLAQFGRYIGDWKIEDSKLAQDGSGWSAGSGGRWIFACLGNGTAIQDFWLPANGNVGTNLRTYNPDTSAWDIAWVINSAPGLTHIAAEQDAAGNIVMRFVAPIPNPLRRITFFAPDDTGWNWQLEMSWDEGENWTEVYRMRATPFSPPVSD